MPATLWAPRIVGDDDVAGLQGRHQDLFDVGAEALAIDRAVEDTRCGQPRDPQRGEQRAGLPAPAGGVVVDARATRCPAVPPKQMVGEAGFVQKHEVGDVPGRRGVVARILTGPHDANRQDSHLPMRYDTGRPRAVIRLRISQPRTTSLPCPAGFRARRPSPTMDLYRKNAFSTRP